MTGNHIRRAGTERCEVRLAGAQCALCIYYWGV